MTSKTELDLIALLYEVQAGLEAADIKHGPNSITQLPADSNRWLAILVEEVGETANTLTYDAAQTNSASHESFTRAELLDVLTVTAAWIIALDEAAQKRWNHNV